MKNQEDTNMNERNYSGEIATMDGRIFEDGRLELPL